MPEQQERPNHLEEALALWEQGFHVIPLGDPFTQPPGYLIDRCGSYEEAQKTWPKTPRGSWKQYQNEAPSREQVEKWWTDQPTANIGIVTSNVVVIDADSQDAIDWIERNPREVSFTPWRVNTRQGRHYYYQSSSRLVVKNSTGKRKIDVRGIGGYVVAPPSVAFDGTPYAWDIKDDNYDANSLHDLPVIGHETIASVHKYNSTGADRPRVSGDDLGVSLGDVSVAATESPAPVGMRNNAAASLAGQYIHNGMSLAEIQQAMHAWNSTNPQPLPAGELDRTVASVVRTHMANHPERPVPVRPEKKAIEVFSFGRLQDSPPKEPEFFWNQAALFRGARLMIAGGPKVGKSDLFLAMAVAASHGGHFLGAKFARPLRVLWLQAEIHQSFLKRRMDRLTGGLTREQTGRVRDNLYMTGRLYLDLVNPFDRKQVTDIVGELKPDIVCCDPVINFSSANENDNVEVHKLLHALDVIGETTDCAVVAVHHTAKNIIPTDPFAAIRGASAFRGWYDTGVLLNRTEGGITVNYELRNAETLPTHGLTFDTDTGTYLQTLITDAEDGLDASQEKVNADLRTARYLLSTEPDGLYYATYLNRIINVCQVSKRTAIRLLNRLTDDPDITKIKDGRQTIYRYETTPGEDV